MRSGPTAVHDLQQVAPLLKRRRRRPRSQLRHRAEHGLFRLGVGLLRSLPRPTADAGMRFLARLFLMMLPRRRRILLTNLAHAFPEKGSEELRAIARASVENFLVAFFDFLESSRLSADELRERVRVTGVEHLADARRRGKGVFLLSAHFGSWELAAIAVGLLGEPIASLVRPLDNPLLDVELTYRRTRFGNRIIPKRAAARELLRAMRHNQTVAILVDQNVLEREAVFVPFFGRMAATTPSLALLQLKSGATVLPVFTWPEGGGRYRVEIEEPILPEQFLSSQDRLERVRSATARYVEVTEAAIRKQPAAWLWMHNRWRTRPPSP